MWLFCLPHLNLSLKTKDPEQDIRSTRFPHSFILKILQIPRWQLHISFQCIEMLKSDWNKSKIQHALYVQSDLHLVPSPILRWQVMFITAAITTRKNIFINYLLYWVACCRSLFQAEQLALSLPDLWINIIFGCDIWRKSRFVWKSVKISPNTSNVYSVKIGKMGTSFQIWSELGSISPFKVTEGTFLAHSCQVLPLNSDGLSSKVAILYFLVASAKPETTEYDVSFGTLRCDASAYVSEKNILFPVVHAYFSKSCQRR